MQKKVLAVCLSVLMGLTVFAGCGSKDPTVAKVGSAAIKNSRFKQIFDSYYSQFGITDPKAADAATISNVAQLRDLILDTMVSDEIQMQKAKSLGLDTLTDAMKAEIDAQVKDLMDQLHSSFETEAKGEDATLAGDALESKIQSKIDDYLKSMGYTRDQVKQEYTDTYIKNRLYEQVTSNVTVSEEDMKKTYQDRLAEVKEIYAQDPSSFETDYSEGVTVYYIPQNIRRVKHILIMLPDDVISQISSLRESGYDKEADSIRNSELKSIKAKAQEALGKLKADGSNFDEIMKQYSGDTASFDLANGYAVSKTSSGFTQDFVKGSFAIKKPMTISGLVAGDYGYHIILYIETMKTGDVAYETVKADIQTEMLSVAKQDAYNALLEQWKKEITVTKYIENTEYYRAAPAATSPAASPQTTP